MLTTTATLLALLTPALALVLPRAGGPAYIPLPPNCAAPNPLPASPPGSAANYSATDLLPSAAVVAASQIYAIYLPLPDYETMAARWEGCLEQCNGLDGCVAAFMADGVKTPPGWYGMQGGVSERACWMFNETLTEAGFECAEGVGNGTAGNIVCS